MLNMYRQVDPPVDRRRVSKSISLRGLELACHLLQDSLHTFSFALESFGLHAMFPGASLPSLLCAALCLVSRAVSPENLEHGEDKDSLVSLSLTTPPAGDLEPINSSEEDRRHASAVPLDSGASFSASLLDASDTWTEPDRLRAGAKHLYTHLNGIQSGCMYLTSQIIQICT